jgi:hypothetical protein
MDIEPFYCNECHIDVILPQEWIKPDNSGYWLIIGFPGIDGLEFRMKNNSEEKTVYAFLPNENRHRTVASSPEELVKKWKENALIF